MNATNRQKKVLKFFELDYSPNISSGAAGWEIGILFKSEENRERWCRYILATGDYTNESEDLREFTEGMLDSVKIPEGKTARDVVREERNEFVEEQMADGSPFDSPQPKIEYSNRTFLFTGRFDFGGRAACQKAVIEMGGSAPSVKSVGPEVDYLVIGQKGSTQWSHGAYGNKIASAILKRREAGRPAIISESHWVASLS